MSAKKELQFRRFGRLFVVEQAAPVKGRRRWKCWCSCGATAFVGQKELLNGDTKSCGCLFKEMLQKRNTTHGRYFTKAHIKWRSLWRRVRAPVGKNACYAGVSVCKRWRKFESFYADMGDPPKGYTLERKKNSKGYSKSNCEWVPFAQQMRNTTRNVYVKWKGKKMCLSEAARAVGLTPDIVLDRVNKLKWSVEGALSTPKCAQGAGPKRKYG